MTSKDLSLFETSGFSMWPFLRPGEKLLIKRIPIEDLRIGDMILYQKDAHKICHRLVKKIRDKEKAMLYLRGDNSFDMPECIAEEIYSGKVIGALKSGRVVDLTGRRYQFINRIIVFISPFTSRINRITKPLYGRFLHRRRKRKEPNPCQPRTMSTE